MDATPPQSSPPQSSPPQSSPPQSRPPLSLPPSLQAARIAALTADLPAAAETTTVQAPFTGERLLELPLAGVAVVHRASRRARAAQPDWSARGVRARAAVLLRWHDLVLNRAEDLLDVIQAESGKARGHAFEEVADTANTLRYYARTAETALAARRRTGVFPLLTQAVELRHPHGLVGVISPWNYPLTLAAGDVIPALAAGNAVLHKPDSQTALTTLLVRELAIEAGLPAELWSVVVGEPATVGPALIESVDHLVFTGSTATGRIVARQAGERLVRADLELGGKNPMIVCSDANLRAAVNGAVRGAFSSAGQLCLSFERLHVHESVFDPFMTKFAAATRRLRLGAGFDYRFDIGSLVGPAQLAKVTEHVDDAVAHGAAVHAGGRARPDVGPYFYEPTVLAGVPADAACFSAETFGPVVSVYPVASDEEAIARANASEYALNASVWSRSPGRARAIAKRLRAGTVNINEAYAAAWGSVDAPMGGVGASGMGRRHGEAGLLTSTWAQTIARQRLWPVGEHGLLRGRPYQAAMTAALRGLKAVGRK